jgi:hypothetical protein
LFASNTKSKVSGNLTVDSVTSLFNL